MKLHLKELRRIIRNEAKRVLKESGDLESKIEAWVEANKEELKAYYDSHPREEQRLHAMADGGATLTTEVSKEEKEAIAKGQIGRAHV